jgi:hypothetical protein
MFHLVISFVELIVFEVHLFMQYECARSWQHVGPIRPHQKKRLSNIVSIYVVSDRNHTHSMTYAIVVSIHAENNRYIIIHHHLSSKWRYMCLTLHRQRCIRYENVFTCGRGPQDIPRSPHPRCMIMSSRMIDNTVHISQYRPSSGKPCLEFPGFTSPHERLSYVPIETYSLPIMIAVRPTQYFSCSNGLCVDPKKVSQDTLCRTCIFFIWCDLCVT